MSMQGADIVTLERNLTVRLGLGDAYARLCWSEDAWTERQGNGVVVEVNLNIYLAP